MLIEVKVKVAWVINNKVKKRQETFILDKESFALAEQEVTITLNVYKRYGSVDSYEIQCLKLSNVKEIVTQYEGSKSFIAVFKDTIHLDDGTEKQIKYKVLLWADNISDAMAHAREIIAQGYDMQIDGLKEVSFTFLNSFDNEDATTSEN